MVHSTQSVLPGMVVILGVCEWTCSMCLQCMSVGVQCALPSQEHSSLCMHALLHIAGT